VLFTKATFVLGYFIFVCSVCWSG